MVVVYSWWAQAAIYSYLELFACILSTSPEMLPAQLKLLQRANKCSISSLFLSYFGIWAWEATFFSPNNTSNWCSYALSSGYENFYNSSTFLYNSLKSTLILSSTSLSLRATFSGFFDGVSSERGTRGSSFSIWIYLMILFISCLSSSDSF